MRRDPPRGRLGEPAPRPPAGLAERTGYHRALRVEGAALPDGRMVELEGYLLRTGATWTLRSARRVDPGFGRQRSTATPSRLASPQAPRAAGMTADDVGKLLGGNYARVFAASMSG